MNNQNERNNMDDMQDVRRAKAEYLREWRRKNPDKQKAIIERYWRKKVAAMQEQASTTDDEKED